MIKLTFIDTISLGIRQAHGFISKIRFRSPRTAFLIVNTMILERKNNVIDRRIFFRS